MLDLQNCTDIYRKLIIYSIFQISKESNHFHFSNNINVIISRFKQDFKFQNFNAFSDFPTPVYVSWNISYLKNASEHSSGISECWTIAEIDLM